MKILWSLLLKLESTCYSTRRHQQYQQWNMWWSWWWRALNFITWAGKCSWYRPAKKHAMIGKLLCRSGWVNILSHAEVLTSGHAQSALNRHHIKRTGYIHPVSLVSLHAKAECLPWILWQCHGPKNVIWYVGSTFESCASVQVLVNYNEYGVIDDMLCLFPAVRGPLSYGCKHVTNSAAGFMPGAH